MEECVKRNISYNPIYVSDLLMNVISHYAIDVIVSDGYMTMSNNDTIYHVWCLYNNLVIDISRLLTESLSEENRTYRVYSDTYSENTTLICNDALVEEYKKYNLNKSLWMDSNDQSTKDVRSYMLSMDSHPKVSKILDNLCKIGVLSSYILEECKSVGWYGQGLFLSALLKEIYSNREERIILSCMGRV